MIKQALGKLDVPNDFRGVLDDQPFEIWKYQRPPHAVIDLPIHHRDLFDCMLVAQAMVEGLT